MAITYEQIMERLLAEGYENVHGHGTQIIVNNRGEIDLYDGEATISDRLTRKPGYGNHESFHDINELFADIMATWPKFEPTNAFSVLGYIDDRPVFKGDRLYVDIRGTCATEWGNGQFVDNSANEGQGLIIIFQDGDYRMARNLVWVPIK